MFRNILSMINSITIVNRLIPSGDGYETSSNLYTLPKNTYIKLQIYQGSNKNC